MLRLTTFRSRLIFYIFIISVFLATALSLSFWHTQNILLTEANQQLQRTSRLLDTYLATERSELERYAGIVRENLRMQEYMYVVTEINAEREPLDKLFLQQFGWLPIDNRILTNTKGEIISGNTNNTIIDPMTLNTKDGIKIHYVQTEDGVELVACSPVYYLKKLIGYVILTRTYDFEKLRELENITKGRVFVTNKDVIALSTIPSLIKKPLLPQEKNIPVMNDNYIVTQIKINNATNNNIRFYFGVSESRLLNNIKRFRQLLIFIITFGILGVLVLGLIFLRDFDKPIKQLLAITNEVADGKLPSVTKVTPRNEIDYLRNHFSNMIRSLQEKQTLISKAQTELEVLAITDTLTHLYNRRHLLEVFPKLQAQAQRDKAPLAAIIIDIDHFKNINDEHGHLAGDQCLVEFSALLRSHSRTNDYLFRLGGEEFLILTLGETTKGVHAVAEKIRKATEQTPVQYRNIHIRMTISCGICVEYPTDDKEQSLNSLLLHSDNALYTAKQTGRNKIVVHQHDDNQRKKFSP